MNPRKIAFGFGCDPIKGEYDVAWRKRERPPFARVSARARACTAARCPAAPRWVKKNDANARGGRWPLHRHIRIIFGAIFRRDECEGPFYNSSSFKSRQSELWAFTSPPLCSCILLHRQYLLRNLRAGAPYYVHFAPAPEQPSQSFSSHCGRPGLGLYMLLQFKLHVLLVGSHT